MTHVIQHVSHVLGRLQLNALRVLSRTSLIDIRLDVKIVPLILLVLRLVRKGFVRRGVGMGGILM